MTPHCSSSSQASSGDEAQRSSEFADRYTGVHTKGGPSTLDKNGASRSPSLALSLQSFVPLQFQLHSTFRIDRSPAWPTAETPFGLN